MTTRSMSLDPALWIFWRPCFLRKMFDFDPTFDLEPKMIWYMHIIVLQWLLGNILSSWQIIIDIILWSNVLFYLVVSYNVKLQFCFCELFAQPDRFLTRDFIYNTIMILLDISFPTRSIQWTSICKGTQQKSSKEKCDRNLLISVEVVGYKRSQSIFSR